MSVERSWVIFENSVFGWMTPARMPRVEDQTNIIQPPEIHSKEELELFVEDLIEAGKRVFGETDD